MFTTRSWGFHLDLPRLAQGLEALFLLLVIVVVVAATVHVHYPPEVACQKKI